MIANLFFSFLGGILGIGYYYAFAPYELSFLLLLIFPLLFMGFRCATTSAAASLLGFFFGFALHLRGLWWIGDVLAMPINNMAFLAYPGRFGLAAVFGLIYALVFWGCSKIMEKIDHSLIKILFFTTMMNGIELLFGHLFGGFPWYLTAYTFMNSNPLIQTASIFGAYGFGFIITFFVLLLGAFFYMDLTFKRRLSYMALGLFIFAFLFNFGEKRIEHFFEDARYEKVPGVKMHLIGTAMPMDQKWKAGDESRILENLLNQSVLIKKEAGFNHVVIWPETAIAFDLALNLPLRQKIMASFDERTILIVGAFRHAFEGGVKKVYNTLYVLGRDGAILGYYDKHHLVPFGEFVPFAGLFPFVHALVEGLPDLSSGEGLKIIDVQGIPAFSPLLCYEGIFPTAIIPQGQRPQWLLTITNDGWFVEDGQKAQHFAIQRLRAVEYGMPLVRVANLGDTTIVDALGRDAFIVHKKNSITPLLKPLPTQTFFSKYPQVMTFLLFVIGLSLSIGFIFLKNQRNLANGRRAKRLYGAQ